MQLRSAAADGECSCGQRLQTVASACVNAVVNGSGRQWLWMMAALRAATAAGGSRSNLLHYLFYLLSRVALSRHS